jgi:hypothetical protein
VVKIGAICVVHSLATLRQNGQLHSDTKTKANILNEQFQKAFTPATDDPIPNNMLFSVLFVCLLSFV